MTTTITSGTGLILRPYQQRMVEDSFEKWQDTQSTLVVCPTGGGKTAVFAEICRRVTMKLGWGRVMVIAHREELIDQAARTIERVCGDRFVDIEMADRWADQQQFWLAPVILGSVQTLSSSRGGRMQRFDPFSFGLIIIDEGHHATAETYRRVITHFKQNPNIKILGVTATPDRADEEALGQVFDSVASNIEILDLIDDGWLVPIKQEFVTVYGLDFSRIPTTAGDLNQAELARVMELEQNLHGLADATTRIAGGRRTLVFAASLLQAELLTSIFNRHIPDSAICQRRHAEGHAREILRDYGAGRFQTLVNVGVATEGFDVPGIEVVAMGRPTKSRSLYAQMIGRGTRPLSGLVDGVGDPDSRRQAIAASAKPHLHVIDFVGNAGRHKLVSTADVLGGNTEDTVIARASQIMLMAGQEMDPREALERAQLEADSEQKKSAVIQRSEDARLIAKSRYIAEEIDPFSLYDIRPAERGWDKIRPPTAKQLAILDKQGINYEGLNNTEIKQLIQQVFDRMKRGLSSVKQVRMLRRSGIDAREMTVQEASAQIDRIKKRGRQPA